MRIVPWSRALSGNFCNDPRFDLATGTFAVWAGDTGGFQTSGHPLGGQRFVRLIATGFRTGSTNTSYRTANFYAPPFSRLRVRLLYRIIGADLTLSGGTGNRNHGIALTLQTSQGSAPGNSGGSSDDWTLNGANDSSATYRRPYLSNGEALQEHVCTMTTGFGQVHSIAAGLLNCTGTVDIIGIVIEKAESLVRSPLMFSHTLNASAVRNIDVPSTNTTNGRRWAWQPTVIADLAAPTYTTVNYAEEDSAAIAAPTTSQTCYILGKGAGAFANQGGRIATWNGSAWTFADQPINTFVRCNSGSQGIGGNRRWFHKQRSNAAGAINRELYADEASFISVQMSGVRARVADELGFRTSAFTIFFRPVLTAPFGL